MKIKFFFLFCFLISSSCFSMEEPPKKTYAQIHGKGRVPSTPSTKDSSEELQNKKSSQLNKKELSFFEKYIEGYENYTIPGDPYQRLYSRKKKQ